MGPVYYSVKSRRKIVHLAGCGYINRIEKENIRSFKSLEEAEKHGYRLCRCCPSVSNKYRRENKKITRFCKAKGFMTELHNGVLHIISACDCWRIITNGKNNSLFLYHKNTDMRFRREKRPSIIPGYHSQKYRSDTIMGYLRYINSHDEFRSVYPFGDYSYLKKRTEETYERPDYNIEKYGEVIVSPENKSYTKIKGTNQYRKDQKKKKKIKRRAEITRVYALLDEMAAVGF